MDEYTLSFKNREIARGELFVVLLEANARGALAKVTPSQRGYRWQRLFIDLAADYEIKSA